jgi:Fe-S cluster assembly ATP-binding protein
MLKIKNLWVSTDGKEILKGVELTVGDKERHVLVGANGAGKSCLAMTIMGMPVYRVNKGEITFDGKDITTLPIYERAKLGIALAFQNPPIIRGVKLRDIISLHTNKVDDILNRAYLNQEFGRRDVNLGFSGGERKRSELAQLFAMEPRLLLLDEIDSGVDIESMELLGKEINSFLSGRSALIITHLGYILNYVKADKAHILLDGKIILSGKPEEVLTWVKEKGFKGDRYV